MKFLFLRNKYSESTQNLIQHEFDLLEDVALSREEKAHALKRLTFFVNYLPNLRKDTIKASERRELIKKVLDREFPGQEELKKTLLSELANYVRSEGRRAPRILVLDTCRCDVDLLLKRFFTLAGMRCGEIFCAGVNDSGGFLGSSDIYSNADIGFLAKSLRETPQAMIVRDIDKIKDKPSACALECLKRGSLYNELLGDIDVRSTWFVFTVTAMEDLPWDPSGLRTVETRALTEKEQFVFIDLCLKKSVREQGYEEENVRILPSAKKKLLRYGRNRLPEIREFTEEIVQNAVMTLKEATGAVTVSAGNLARFLPLLAELPYLTSTVVDDLPSLRKKLVLLGNGLIPPGPTKRAERLLEDYETADKSERIRILKMLKGLVNTLDRTPAPVDVEAVRREMNEALDYIPFAVDEVLDQLCARTEQNGFRYTPLILAGPPGTGKTSFAEALSRALGIPSVKIHCNQISTNEELTGYPISLKMDKPGRLFGAISGEGGYSYHTMVIFDEIDKLQPNGFAPFYNLFDYQEAEDAWYGTSYPTNHLLMVCTCNDEEKVPPTIRDRCLTLRFPQYTRKQRLNIARHHLIPKTVKALEIERAVPENVLALIEREYTCSGGVRELEHGIERTLRRAKRLNQPVTEELVRDCLGTTSMANQSAVYRVDPAIGCSCALGVAGYSGLAFHIEALKPVKGKGDDGSGLRLSGGARRGFVESAQVAMLVAEELLGDSLGKICLHCSEAGLEKDGPSAGLAFLAAILSLETGTALPDSAFTGELMPSGKVAPVGGMIEKLVAAEREPGCSRVFLPRENYEDLCRRGMAENFSLTLVPVGTVRELCGYVFPNIAERSRAGMN